MTNAMINPIRDIFNTIENKISGVSRVRISSPGVFEIIQKESTRPDSRLV